MIKNYFLKIIFGLLTLDKLSIKHLWMNLPANMPLYAKKNVLKSVNIEFIAQNPPYISKKKLVSSPF